MKTEITEYCYVDCIELILLHLTVKNMKIV
jgi:hypothetical protein